MVIKERGQGAAERGGPLRIEADLSPSPCPARAAIARPTSNLAFFLSEG